MRYGQGIGALVLVSSGLFGLVGEGASLITVGSLLAVTGVYLSGHEMRGLLVEVSPFDVPTPAGVVVVLAMVGLLACYLAARPVTTIAPERLLRDV